MFYFLGKLAKYFLVMNDKTAHELHEYRKANPQLRVRGPRVPQATKRDGEPLASSSKR